jgi:hypothetical protein
MREKRQKFLFDQGERGRERVDTQKGDKRAFAIGNEKRLFEAQMPK